MIKSVTVQIVSLGYLFLLIGVFSKKQKEKTLENSVYKVFLIITFIMLLLDGISNYLLFFPQYEKITLILLKAFIVSTIIWCTWFIIYVTSLKKDGVKTIKELLENNAYYYVLFVITIILCAVCIYLKSDVFVDSEKFISYQFGQDLYFSYIVNIIYIGLLGIYLISKRKDIEFNKKMAIFTFIFLGLIAIVLQWVFKDLSIVSSIMAFVMSLIYFTMENPDLKIITELEKDKEEANEASKAKTDFLSNMSHDIRTPMNAIIGFSESLLTEDLPQGQKNEVQSIYDAASTLLEIINNILDVSRFESGNSTSFEVILKTLFFSSNIVIFGTFIFYFPFDRSILPKNI